jgi:phosphatidylserine/phosphatidylglycerophosphate/cardiolipin synthase-like enzyme
MIGNRQFLQSASDTRNVMREVLQLIFASELIQPSRCLWLVSPWLRNIPILDNSTGSFTSLCPDFPLAEISLSWVLRQLLNRGTQIVIATRPESGNQQVLDSLELNRPTDDLIFHERAELHAKGILSDRFALFGSMNFTYNGLERLTEMVVLQTQREEVENLRLIFRNEYGGTI